MDNVRIYITGAAGVGKTTLANRIARRLNIPFISTSAKLEVWPNYGVNKYNDAHKLCVNDREKALSYHSDIFYKRLDALEGLSWVTDRSPIDNLAYFMLQASHHDTEDELIDNMLLAFRRVLLDSNIIVYLKLNPLVLLEDDGYRVINKLHQDTVDALISRSIKLLDLEKLNKVVELPAFSKGDIDNFLVNLPQIIGSRLKR